MGILKYTFDYFFGFADSMTFIYGDFDQIQIINGNFE